MNVGDWASAALSAVQAAAIIGAGAWAYYKFVRGRTFHRRAEVEVQAALITTPPACRVQVTMKNTGGSEIPLRWKEARLSIVDTPAVAEAFAWRQIGTARIFEDHELIESQETIGDDVLIPVDVPFDATKTACCVTCVVYERRGPGESGGTAWTGKVIIPPSVSTLRREVNDEREGARLPATS